MNTTLVTTGLLPLVIGSIQTFQLSVWKDKLPWNLMGGSAHLFLRDPTGFLYDAPGVVNQTGARANWQVIGPQGAWTRWWLMQDASGIIQVSRAIVFNVVFN